MPPAGDTVSSTVLNLQAGSDGGAIAVAGPSGFCVLKRTQKRQGRAEFVALTRCPSGFGFQAGGAPATLTATVGEEGTANGVDLTGKGLAGFFTSPEGRRALSRKGQASGVTVHEVSQARGAVMVRFSEADGSGRQSVWRAVMALRGRLVTLSVQRQGDAEIPVEDGRRLLSGFVAAMRRANAV